VKVKICGIREVEHALAATHAGADYIAIEIAEGGKRLIQVSDNGTGFDVEEVMQAVDQYKTIGLATLRERVEMLGGRLHIDSGIGRGTKVSLEIPAV